MHLFQKLFDQGKKIGKKKRKKEKEIDGKQLPATESPADDSDGLLSTDEAMITAPAHRQVPPLRTETAPARSSSSHGWSGLRGDL